jgi:hypothetical protein
MTHPTLQEPRLGVLAPLRRVPSPFDSDTGSWFCMSNIATANRSTLERMAATGCTKVMYGVKSTDSTALKLIAKRRDYEQVRRTFAATFECGIIPRLFYIVGFPWESPDHIEACLGRMNGLEGLSHRRQWDVEQTPRWSHSRSTPPSRPVCSRASALPGSCRPGRWRSRRTCCPIHELHPISSR